MTNQRFETIMTIYKETIRKLYKAMNNYLENIIKAPSTINRLFRYYAIGLPSDPTIQKRYIMFRGTIVREYELVLPKVECGIDGIRINGELL